MTEETINKKQGFWEWWFSFKDKKGLSLLRIPLGAILLASTIFVGLANFASLIDNFRVEPLYTGMLFIVLFPVMIAVSFIGAILWGSLFYIPYLAFEEERSGWKGFFKYLGILLAIIVGLSILGFIIFN